VLANSKEIMPLQQQPSDLGLDIQRQGRSFFQHGLHQAVLQHVDDQVLLRQ